MSMEAVTTSVKGTCLSSPDPDLSLPLCLPYPGFLAPTGCLFASVDVKWKMSCRIISVLNFTAEK